MSSVSTQDHAVRLHGSCVITGMTEDGEPIQLTLGLASGSVLCWRPMRRDGEEGTVIVLTGMVCDTHTTKGSS
jgi:hypothetical protein